MIFTDGQVCTVYGWGLITKSNKRKTHRFSVQNVALKNMNCCKRYYPFDISRKSPVYQNIMCAGTTESRKFWKRSEFSFCPVRTNQ